MCWNTHMAGRDMHQHRQANSGEEAQTPDTKRGSTLKNFQRWESMDMDIWNSVLHSSQDL
jgi:hypothetical protein